MQEQEISNLIRDLFEKAKPYSIKHGKECIGIVCDNPTSTMVLLIREILNDLGISHSNREFQKVSQDILKQLECVKVDNIENYSIIYFPKLPPPEEY